MKATLHVKTEGKWISYFLATLPVLPFVFFAAFALAVAVANCSFVFGTF